MPEPKINIVEKDDEILIEEEIGEDEEKELVTKDPEKDSSEDEEKSTPPDNHEDEDGDIPEAYRGKSVAEIVKIAEEGKRTITKLSTDNASLKKGLTPDDHKKVLTVNDIRLSLIDQKSKLSQIDPVEDPNEYKTQLRLVSQLEVDLSDKKQEEFFSKQLISEKNTSFKNSMKEELSDLELNDEEFEELSSIAANNAINGQLSKGAYYKAMFDKYGADKVVKYLTIKGELKTRDDIKNAKLKDDNKVKLSDKSTKKTVKSLSGMSPGDTRRVAQKLSDEQLDAMISKVVK